MVELHEEAANISQKIIDIQNSNKTLIVENQQLKSDRAMDRATIESLRQQNTTLTAKMEYYQRRTAELDNTISNVGSLLLKSINEGRTQEYRPNGAAKIVDETKLEEDMKLPSVVTQGPKIQEGWK